MLITESKLANECDRFFDLEKEYCNGVYSSR